MFDKTPRAMALLGALQRECAAVIGTHQWNRFQLESCQKGTITVGNLVRERSTSKEACCILRRPAVL